MPSPLPYYEFYPRDFLSSSTVAMMDLVAEGIFRRLLDFQWEDGGLVDDPDKLARLARAKPEQWADFEPFLDDCFPVDSDGLRRNPRMAHDRQAAMDKVQGKKDAANKRWHGESKADADRTKTESNADDKQAECASNADAMHAQCGSNAKPTTATTKKEVLTTFVLPKNPPWWDDEPLGLVVELARGVSSTRLQGGKEPYAPDVIPREKCLKLAARWVTLGGDSEQLESLLAAWHEYHSGRRKAPYSDPLRAISNWIDRREPDMIRLRRQRQIEAERSARSGGVVDIRSRAHALIDQMEAQA